MGICYCCYELCNVDQQLFAQSRKLKKQKQMSARNVKDVSRSDKPTQHHLLTLKSPPAASIHPFSAAAFLRETSSDKLSVHLQTADTQSELVNTAEHLAATEPDISLGEMVETKTEGISD